jgi:dihydrofolate reductase
MSYLGLEIVLIVATAKRGVIGANNAMPWHLPEDLAHFKALTSGHTVIMGRKTFESIGRPLPKRRNIMVTREIARSAYRDQGALELAPSLEQALALSQTPYPFLDLILSPIFVIGGAQLYQGAMAYADRIELTQIELEVIGDTYFPEIDPVVWVKDEEGPKQVSAGGLGYQFQSYRRRPGTLGRT